MWKIDIKSGKTPVGDESSQRFSALKQRGTRRAAIDVAWCANARGRIAPRWTPNGGIRRASPSHGRLLPVDALPIPSASRTFGASRDSSAVASSDAASALSTRAIWELWRRWATGARFPSSRLPSASCAAGLPSAAGKDPFRPPNDTTLLRSDLPWLLAAPSSHANGPFRTELKNTC